MRSRRICVPGLPGKDCIDLMFRTRQVDELACRDALGVGGYRLRPERWNLQDDRWGHHVPRAGLRTAGMSRHCRTHGVQPLVSKAPSELLMVTEAAPSVMLLAMMLSASPLSFLSRAQ